MDIFLWLIMGGLVGWIASMIMRSNTPQGTTLHIVVGIVGALIGGWLFGPLFGANPINDAINITSFIVPLVGAMILISFLSMILKFYR